MKTLLLLRHAKSSWGNAWLDDHDRPLNKRGKHDAPRMGELLVQQGLVPDVLVTSTAKRARKTATAVAEACGYAGDVIEMSDLYLASPDECMHVLRTLPDQFTSALLVAHNPGLEQLLFRLTGSEEVMATATLAQIALPISQWNDVALNGDATLVSIWRPRELA